MSLGLRRILAFAPFQALWEPFFTRWSSASAHTNSVAKIAKPTRINAIPGPGSTNKATPTNTKVPPMLATVSQRSGWGSRRQGARAAKRVRALGAASLGSITPPLCASPSQPANPRTCPHLAVAYFSRPAYRSWLLCDTPRRAKSLASDLRRVYGSTPRCSSHTVVIPPQVVVLHTQVVHR